MDRPIILCVDFDGTTVIDDFPRIGKEKKGAISTLKDLQESGFKIVIWTCREGKFQDKMVAWLHSNGFFPDAINENVHPNLHGSAKHKVYADFYLDDKSFPPFTNWDDVREEFLS